MRAAAKKFARRSTFFHADAPRKILGG